MAVRIDNTISNLQSISNDCANSSLGAVEKPATSQLDRISVAEASFKEAGGVVYSQGRTSPMSTYNANGEMSYITNGNVAYAGKVSRASEVSLDEAKKVAKKITVMYEGGQVTGNFDGQGISIGYLQWNIGQGTLQPLLKEMANNQDSKADFNKIFSAKVSVKDSKGNTVEKPMSDVLREVLNKSKSEQLTWAKSINDKSNKIAEPWKAAFNNLVNNDKFIKIEDKYAKEYLDNATSIMNDADIGVRTVRGYALAFDISVQNWSVSSNAKSLVKDAIKGKKNKLTDPNDPSLTSNQKAVITDLNNRLKKVTDPDIKKLYYVAAAVAISSKDAYVKDVWARKSTIVAGSGTVHGTSYNFDRDAGLSNASIK